MYLRLHDEQEVAGVDPLDGEAVLRAFAEELPGWMWDGQFLRPPGGGPEDAPVFDVWMGRQYVKLAGYASTGELGNAVIGAMRSLGLRLYDPQVSERFIEHHSRARIENGRGGVAPFSACGGRS